ncbi:hypothetical protein MGA3_03180 [Bacillus methanolicus MGA3]|nr:hypothetical protein MGA3_03180 [Bacillus methanolicus MGA3]
MYFALTAEKGRNFFAREGEFFINLQFYLKECSF